MNYRHAFHAGNFADVIKHLALVAILERLRHKETAFAVIDSHAGRGLYDLESEEARRGGEWQGGIGRLRGREDGPQLVRHYRALVSQFGAMYYPGSPLVAASLLRPQDRLIAIEKHPEEFAALNHALRPFKHACAVEGDGYERLAALLPPKERRGLLLIDPPYESPDEGQNVVRAVKASLARFATGIILIWFPIKSAAEVDAFCGEIKAQSTRKLLRLDFQVGRLHPKLKAAGLLAVNPPYGFEAEMTVAMQYVAQYLGREEAAKYRICWLSSPD